MVVGGGRGGKGGEGSGRRWWQWQWMVMVKVILVYVRVLCNPQLDICTGCPSLVAHISIPSIPFSLGIIVSPSQFFRDDSLAPITISYNYVS